MTLAYDYTKRTSYTADVEKQKRAHKVLLEVPFTPSLPQRGYTNRTLHVDLGTLKVTEKPVTEQMKDVFIGGRGFGLWYLWNADQADDEVERPRERDHHQPRPAGRQHPVPRLRQVARRHPLAADRHPDRLQRRRLLRPAAEVLRLRRAGDPGQGGAATSSSSSTARRATITHRGGARGGPRQPRGWPRSSRTMYADERRRTS